VLRDLAPALPRDPNLLVGFDTSDDAGVYRLNDETALVQTVDVFTPVVDDPYDFGQIAAANALSDIYAMGATPLTALNIAAFPRGELPFEVLGEILRGGHDKAREAGAALLGGHTVEAREPLYGLAVTGTVHPNRIATNAGAREGDVLVLTKPLGTGLVSTAIKRGSCPPEWERAATLSMATLNRAAGEAMQVVGIGPTEAIAACTDITGFGLLGHALEVARASNASLNFDFNSLPLLPGALELAREGGAPGGTGRNRLSAREGEVEAKGEAWRQEILWDPQTSGGLLICVRLHFAARLLEEMERRGVTVSIVGEVLPAGGARVRVS
jgi:selenide,water dikinase